MRILIVASNAPGDAHVGQILLRDMLDLIEGHELHVAVVKPNAHNGNGSHPALSSVVAIEGPQDSNPRRLPGRVGGALELLRRISSYDAHVRRVSNDVASCIGRVDPDLIWFILGSIAMVDVAFSVTSTLNRAFVTQVWDDIDHLAVNAGLESFGRRRVRSRFAQLLAGSERVGVIGESMARCYEQEFGARCTVVRQGVERSAQLESGIESDEMVIGFAGAMYASDAFGSLLNALESLDWTVGSRPVRLRILGGHVELDIPGSAHIELLGRQPSVVVASMLADCDLLYLPQSFDSRMRSLSELSFPTKLSVYVAAGCPILVQAPTYGSLVDFNAEHFIGPCVTTLDPHALANAMVEFFCDGAMALKARANIARVAETVLSRDRFKQGIEELLSLDAMSPGRFAASAIGDDRSQRCAVRR